MRLGVRGDADREVADLADEVHELDRVVELARREVEILRRVAARARGCSRSRRRGSASTIVDQLGAGVRGAREVRHRGHRRVAVDLDDEVVGALARRPAGAVGDRDVRRLQRLELAQRLREHAFRLLVARREELEREARARLRGSRDLQARQATGLLPPRYPRIHGVLHAERLLPRSDLRTTRIARMAAIRRRRPRPAPRCCSPRCRRASRCRGSRRPSTRSAGSTTTHAAHHAADQPEPRPVRHFAIAAAALGVDDPARGPA